MKRLQLADIWLVYPLLLFSLPDDWRFTLFDAAPESAILLVVLFVLLSADLALNGARNIVDTLGRIPPAVYVFILALMLSFSLSGSPLMIFRCLMWFAAFFLAFHCMKSDANLMKLFHLWTALALACAIYLLITPRLWSESEVNVLAWQHRTTLSYFMALPATIFAYRVILKRRNSFFNWAGLALLVSAIALCFSRGSWLVGAIALLSLMIIKKRYLLATICVAVSSSALAAFLLLSDSLYALRIRSIIDLSLASSSLYRFDLYRSAIRATRDLPIWGAGPGSAGQVLNRYASYYYPVLFREDFSVDSDFIWLLIEHGPVTVICFIVIVLLMIRRTIACGRVKGEADVISLGLFFVFLGLATFDCVLSSAFGWFVFGVVAGGLFNRVEIERRCAVELRESLPLVRGAQPITGVAR